MGKREQRLDAIRDIVRDAEVRSQRELADLLDRVGFRCTQATISRDVVEIGLVKSEGGIYVLPEEMQLKRTIADMVESVVAAGNLVVVKTRSGNAPAVSAVLDDASLEGIVGSVAGDDTIFLAASAPEVAQRVSEEIGRHRR